MVITKTAVGETAVAVLAAQSVTVKSLYQFNSGNAAAYLQLFNAVSVADVTVGTTVPNAVVGASTVDDTQLSNLNWLFPKGLVIACTAAPTTNAAPNATQVVTLEVN